MREQVCVWRLLAYALVSATLCVQASALNPDRAISQYAHTAWRVQDGYFNGQPTALGQTTDGYLWIGTRAGLMHFDGVRFVSWTPPAGEQLPSPFITYLLGARDGSLWIGTSAGLAHSSNGKLQSVGLLRGAFVERLLEDRDGTVWITHTRGTTGLGGFCQAKEAKVRCYGTADGIPYPYTTGMVDDASGSFWIAGENAITRWRPGSSKTYTLRGLESQRQLFGIQDLALSKEGVLWVGVPKTGARLGLEQLVDGVFKPFISKELDSSTINVNTLTFTRSGSLMIGSEGQGFYSIYDGKVDHFQATDGLTGNAIQGMHEDREGNLWVATSEGVDCFSDRTVATFSSRQGLSADHVMSVFASANGNVWIGNQLGLDLLSQGKISSIRKANGFPGEEVTALFEERPGLLWLGVDNDLWIYEKGRFTPIKRPNGTQIGAVLAMTRDVDGSMWIEIVGAPAKLIHLRDRALQEEIIIAQAKPWPTLAPDPLGGVWLVLPDGPLARYQKGKLQTFPLKEKPAIVRNIVLDANGWLLEATTDGLVVWRDGEARRLTALNGLPCSRVYSLVWDNRGSLWLYAECGLIETSGEELQAWWKFPETRVKFRILDAFAGTQPGESPFRPSVAKSPDGRLWFANSNMLQMVNPAQLDRNTIPPPVHVEEVVANRQSYSPQQGLRLPPLLRDLEIDYTALSFVTPKKVFFRYMLEGHDTSWQEPGTRRQAFYTDLPPGSYRFRVIASNNDGLWNEAGDALNFSIAPTYYQTAWFRVLCFAATAGLLWLFYFIRLKQATAKIQERLGARLEERERIARELHDTLLQGFQGLMLRFQAVVKTLPEQAPAHQMLEKVLDRADEVLLEGRQSVRDLREEGTLGGDLSQALALCGQELAQDHTSVFTLAVVGTPQALGSVVFSEVYRIAREGLINAFTHSQASKIEVELTYYKDRLTLRVRDDGKGIDAQTVGAGREGHWGLSGMRERAQKIGAQLNIWSGAGTEIELTVPANIAYPRKVEGSLWRRIRRAAGNPEEV